MPFIFKVSYFNGLDGVTSVPLTKRRLSVAGLTVVVTAGVL